MSAPLAERHALALRHVANCIRFYRKRCDLSDVRDVIALTHAVTREIDHERAGLPVGLVRDMEERALRCITRAWRNASRPRHAV